MKNYTSKYFMSGFGLNQLEDNYDTFKNQYISKLKSQNHNGEIDFNADTYFCIITI